jgi:hypothetical protein
MLRISLATADNDLREGCERLVRFARRHGALASEPEPATAGATA